MRKGQVKIFNALVQAIEGLSFKELMENTKLSNTALANYLKEMQQVGMIRKDLKKRKYLLAQLFLDTKSLANDWQRWMKASAVNFVKLGLSVSKLKDREERIKAMQMFLQASYDMLTLFLWKIIGEATFEYGKSFKKLKSQEGVVRKSQIIHDNIEDWIIGIADSLATAMLLNSDILNEAGNPVFDEILEKTSKNIEMLKKLTSVR
jgi:DNA-binding HxlR family transcriptional regulator